MDLIYRQQYGISDQEMHILQSHADGVSQSTICNELSLKPAELKLVESNIKWKLQAKTPMQMIANAFRAGILKAVCFVLVFSSVITIDNDMMRTRSRVSARAARTLNRTDIC